MSNFLNDSLAQQIERGDVFVANLNPDIAIGANYEFIVNTSTPTASLFIACESDAELQITIYEGATTSSDGAAIALQNMNFASGTTIAATFYIVPTLTGDGSAKISYMKMPENRTRFTPLDRESGVVLDASKKYMLRIANLSDVQARVYFTIFLREL